MKRLNEIYNMQKKNLIEVTRNSENAKVTISNKATKLAFPLNHELFV